MEIDRNGPTSDERLRASLSTEDLSRVASRCSTLAAGSQQETMAQSQTAAQFGCLSGAQISDEVDQNIPSVRPNNPATDTLTAQKIKEFATTGENRSAALAAAILRKIRHH